MEKLLQWNRPSNKHCWEKRFRYQIVPHYAGTNTLQWYKVYYYGEKGHDTGSTTSLHFCVSPLQLDFAYTMRDAKEKAEFHARGVERKRQEDHKKFLEKELQDRPEKYRSFRKENFKVEAVVVRKRDKWDISDIELRVTHNGSQWWNIGLTYEEAQKVIDAMQKALDKAAYLNDASKITVSLLKGDFGYTASYCGNNRFYKTRTAAISATKRHLKKQFTENQITFIDKDVL